MGNGHTKAEEETSGDEHLEVDGNALKGDTKGHDETANGNTDTTTEKIPPRTASSRPVVCPPLPVRTRTSWLTDVRLWSRPQWGGGEQVQPAS